MIIQVDFYKESGKWYAGGEVDLGDVRMYKDITAYKKAIINNQTILGTDWYKRGAYYVVTSDLPESEKDRNYTDFNHGLFFPGEFIDL